MFAKRRFGLQEEDDRSLKKELSTLELSKFAKTSRISPTANKQDAIIGSDAKGLIASIPSGEVLVGILDPDTERAMPLPACFAEYRGKELMFVPEPLLEESAACVQAYYNKRPDSDQVQMVSVGVLEDWLQLLQKAGPGIAGNKNFDWSRAELLAFYEPTADRAQDPETDGGINAFFGSEYNLGQWVRLCRKAWMHDAVDEIPPQKDSWSCGINSAAKGIHMFGCNMSNTDYQGTFLPNAPKSVSKKAISNTGNNMALSGAAVFTVSCLLAPFTGGISLAVALPAGG